MAKDLAAAQASVEALEEQLKGLSDPQKARDVRRRFKEYFEHFAGALSVPGSLASHSRAIELKPSAGGSGGPRAVLAYYFAVLHTAAEFSAAFVPPLTIDSPHQQAQDQIRRPQVTAFIFRNRPPGHQLIVGLEDPPPDSVAFGPDDRRIDLTEQYRVLKSEEYGEVFQFIEPMWRAARASIKAANGV